MFDYNDYLQKKDSITLEESLEIYNSIFNILEFKDDYLHELWKEVIDSALVYANMRINWNYFSREEKHEKDNLRTSYHNTFMINLKAFNKLGEQLELDTSWKEKLGSSENRKRWGDFAGYLLCLENIRAR
ncbi:hypothetical protein SAMN04487774_10828 [Enterococcus faecalis]|uniref:hypothetical protein n=1 Tax=Enterococcus faecalis TaxID=1351 RepID=UPI0004597E35|nr:hypothetical protein [Enterococcus faecalis]KAJ79734.1 hypothetical protein P788_1089 [Enterococcus faecalis MTUP9]SDN75778.1 hypothetical protein SAMN04487774_10828 [Enterococcus faecalis]